MFRSARIKLTAWYLLIIMCISVSFSLVIYRVLSTEMERFARSQQFRIERQLKEGVILPPPNERFQKEVLSRLVDPDLINETKNRLLLVLILVNGTILVVSGGLGYVLAGKTLRPIQDMVDEQNHFISDASHELRTPITSLKSAIEVNMRDKHLSLKETKTLLKESLTDVNKLQSLSDTLLQLSQYQKPNGNTLSRSSLFLDAIVSHAKASVAALAKEKRINIKTSVQHTKIHGNLHELSHLFVIFLDNAIKYSAKNKTIRVSSQTEKDAVLVSIQDEGIGIEEKDVPHIFDRFYRADSARTKTTVGGYGLGLSIAKKIIDSYHGSVRVKTIAGNGSTFSIRLPRI